VLDRIEQARPKSDCPPAHTLAALGFSTLLKLVSSNSGAGALDSLFEFQLGRGLSSGAIEIIEVTVAFLFMNKQVSLPIHGSF
jgi:hypothetical protein